MSTWFLKNLKNPKRFSDLFKSYKVFFQDFKNVEPQMPNDLRKFKASVLIVGRKCWNGIESNLAPSFGPLAQ